MVTSATPVFDRAAQLRTDPDTLTTRLSDESTLLVPLWRSRNLIRDNRAAFVSGAEAAALLDRVRTVVFLGRQEGRFVFAVEVNPSDASKELACLSDGVQLSDLRFVGSFLPRAEAELLAYARGILYWHRHNSHCPKCGRDTRVEEAGHVRVCDTCDRRHFPRTDPAVMVLLTSGDRCLLARQPGFPKGMYSVLAGFVEPGESLEQAAHRETLEEVGIQAQNLRYLQSQAWPFPASLMIGFVADAASEAISLDDEELEEARWFSRDQLREPDGFFIPPPFSLAHQLIQAFLSD